jgi:hypothetical protein
MMRQESFWARECQGLVETTLWSHQPRMESATQEQPLNMPAFRSSRRSEEGRIAINVAIRSTKIDDLAFHVQFSSAQILKIEMSVTAIDSSDLL